VPWLRLARSAGDIRRAKADGEHALRIFEEVCG
jgi:hypothetical protein